MEKSISATGTAILLDYTWPGNVRELENVIERLMVTTKENQISEDEIKFCLVSRNEKIKKAKSFKDKVDDFEIQLIKSYSSQADSIKEISKIADINESTLRKKIKKYGLKIKN